MARNAGYSDAQWAAHADGVLQAEQGTRLRVPNRLALTEQTAFREGYFTRREEMANQPVVREIKEMLGKSLRTVIRRLVSPHVDT
jgi:hypothetical protein